MTNDVVHSDSKPSKSMAPSMAIFVGGAAVGAIAALLLAPQAGPEARKQLSEYGRRTGERMREWATPASDLFATAENENGTAEEASGKKGVWDERMKPRPHARAH